MTFTLVERGLHRSTDGKYEARALSSSVPSSPWRLFRMVLGKWMYVATFKTLGELRTHLRATTSRSANVERDRWNRELGVSR